MGYTTDDLALFTPLLDPSAREGTAYFELHPGELPEPNGCWLEGSFFVRDAAFDFFTGCFHGASESFDYFAFVRFEPSEVDQLLDELAAYLTSLKAVPSRDALFANYNSLFGANIWLDVPTATLAASVVMLGEQMRSFIEGNIQTGQCLWVLGM